MVDVNYFPAYDGVADFFPEMLALLRHVLPS